ncbi:MAG: DEAD/DEAH box helicase [Candidatus Aenigmatarchaeota archaeon]
MKIEELEIPEKSKQKFLDRGIEKLNPPQEQAVEKGALEGESMVVASPTASGKTAIVEFAFLKKILEEGKKCAYIVPLRALAQEKYNDFKEYEDLGIKVAVSVGDYDSSASSLGDYDLIITTSEKMDSILRHDPAWAQDIGLVVSDEIHLLNDESRGPTLEVTLTRLRQLTDAQILGLSATISNADELAGWLGAELVSSDYRPVELYEGVYDGNEVEFQNQDNLNFDKGGRGEHVISDHTLKKDKQALIFASSRRNAESIAEKTGEEISHHLSEEGKKKLDELAEEILNVPSQPTEQCKRLAKCVRTGTAFHHAGLANGQRHLLEDAFRDRLIRIISATPTLAAGVNLPAFRVLIRDAKRYHPDKGMAFIPVLEYEQMSGRAGRPDYDDYGEAILVGKNENQAEELKEKFIEGEAEEIYSKLAVEPVLRTHILSLVATRVTRDRDSLDDFLSKTFFYHQYQDMKRIEAKVDRILRKLEDWRFITREEGSLKPTRVGKRVAELYLDPDSAHELLEGLESEKEYTAFGLLTLISNTSEMRTLRMKDSEFDRIQEELAKHENELLKPVPSPWDLGYESFLSAVKTALMLQDWIKERGEDELMEEYGETPGGLRSRQELADWLLYSMQELARLLNKKDKLRPIRKLRTRLKHGVKEELVPLVRLRGIGRVRARKLWKAGFRGLSDLRSAPTKRLKDVLGAKTGEKVKEQLDTKDDQEILGD